MLALTLKPGRDRSVRRQHPWLLSGAIASVASIEGSAEADLHVADTGDESGAWVAVRSARGEAIGFGHYSPQSTIRVRLLSFGAEDPGESILEERIAAAILRRQAHPLLGQTDAVRLINAEGDGLPGLIADRYADVVVVRASTAGMQHRMATIAEVIEKLTGARAGFQRGDGHAARREGYAMCEGLLWGDLPDRLRILERGRYFNVDVVHGQKTGFYLDQRDARDLIERLSAGRRVLDGFSYTGGFAVAAARGGAQSVTLLDSSAPALELAAENLRLVETDCTILTRRGDAFAGLREAASKGERYDLLILDPPPLAKRKSDVRSAARAYKDSFLHAMACAAPDAHLLVFSCSHHIDLELFIKIASGAAVDAGRDLVIEQRLAAPVDHPVDIHHPEGAYLKGLLLRVVGGGD